MVVLLLLPASACQDDRPGAADRSGAAVSAPFDGCAGLTRPPPRSSATVPGRAGRGGATPLPALTLPCHTGADEVAVADLRGPAVVNLWASWCPPCRQELPVLRDFAQRHQGRVHVLGVVSSDSRSASAALAEDLRLSFPNLLDERGQLLRALERTGLPVTLLVDGDGRVRLIHAAEAFDRDTLDRLVREYLGVVPA